MATILNISDRDIQTPVALASETKSITVIGDTGGGNIVIYANGQAAGIGSCVITPDFFRDNHEKTVMSLPLAAGTFVSASVVGGDVNPDISVAFF